MQFIDKAKNLLENLEIKTGEFVYEQKNNFQIAKVCSELKKVYEKLGRLTYRKLKNIPIDDNEFDLTVEKIELLKLELESLRDGTYANGDSIIFEDGEPVEPYENGAEENE